VIAGQASPPGQSLTPEEQAWLKGHGVVRYAPDPGFEPLEFIGPDGEAAGITPDILRRIASSLGFELVTVRYPTWTEVLDATRRGEVDVLGTLTRTPDREQFLEFSRPYLSLPYVLFVNDGLKRVKGLDDLQGRRLGVVRNYGILSWLSSEHPHLAFQTVPDVRTGLNMVAMGRLDAFLENLPVGVFALGEAALTNVRMVPKQVHDSPQHLAVRKGETVLLGILDKGLAGLNSDDRTAIVSRWTGHDFTRPQPVFSRTAIRVLAGVALLAMVGGLFTLVLIKIVAVRTRALRLSEQRYRTVADFTHDWEYWLGTDGQFLYVSPSCERVTGYRAEEFIRDPGLLVRIVDPADREAFVNLMRESTESGQQHSLDCRIWRKDGAVRWVGHVSRLVFDEHRHVLGIRASNRDITERKQTEQTIERHTRRLECLDAISRAILGAKSPQEIATAALSSLHRLVAFEYASVLALDETGASALVLASVENGRPGPDLGASFALKELYEPGSLAAGKVLDSSSLARAAAGGLLARRLAERDLTSVLVVPLATSGRVVGALNVAARNESSLDGDARETARLVGEQLAVALHQAQLHDRIASEQRRLADLIEDLPLGITILDEGRRVVLGNALARDHLLALGGGQDQGDELVALGGVALDELLVPRHDLLPHELRAGAGRQTVFEVETHQIADGPDRGRWLLLIRDVTREREVERHLEQQDRLALVGQIAGGLAHDLNNMLVAVITYPEVLLRRDDLDPQVRQVLETIAQQGHSSASLVRQILDFSRRSLSAQRPIRLAAQLEDLARLLRRTLPETIKVVLEVDAAAEECAVKADPTQLQQMVMNLAVNARDAMPGGGTLTVSLRRLPVTPEGPSPSPRLRPGDWLELTVRDTGSGIAAEDMQHIFEPFFTTKPVGEGLGVGLAQVQGLVEQHGGVITAESVLGQGATFRLYFPEQSGPVDEAALVVKDLPKGQRERILIVEDDANVRAATRQALEALGYQVEEADNGQEALQRLGSQGTVDLVLTDVTMPEMGGAELTRRLHSLWPGIRVVAMTGYSAEQILRELRAAGVSAIAQKPLGLGQLAELLQGVLKDG